MKQGILVLLTVLSAPLHATRDGGGVALQNAGIPQVNTNSTRLISKPHKVLQEMHRSQQGTAKPKAKVHRPTTEEVNDDCACA